MKLAIEEVHSFDVVEYDEHGRPVERWTFKTETAAQAFKRDLEEAHDEGGT